jgi:hypothetical protein
LRREVYEKETGSCGEIYDLGACGGAYLIGALVLWMGDEFAVRDLGEVFF